METTHDTHQPGSRTAICTVCREPFTYTPLLFEGREVFTRHACPDCSTAAAEAQRVAEQAARAAEAARLRALEWQRVCPPLYRESDPARLPQEPLRRVLAWTRGPRGLILFGDSGQGKTRSAYLRLRPLVDAGVRCEAIHAVAFGDEIATRFSRFEGTAWLKRYERAEVLLFDDLGKEPATERVQTELFGLVERRTAQFRPIIVTTQLAPDELAERYTGHVADALIRRLREFCEPVQFPLSKTTLGI
ncbi:MAG: ATP-binding protein [Limisphaerales bacterium]